MSALRPLAKADIAQAWGWLDIPSEISGWIAAQGYGGGHDPLDWWADEDPDQECFALTGGGAGVLIARRDVPAAEIAGGKIAAVHGQLLARMYSGKSQSYFSGGRHGHPTDVRLENGETVPVSWVAVQCADILPAGGSSHGL